MGIANDTWVSARLPGVLIYPLWTKWTLTFVTLDGSSVITRRDSVDDNSVAAQYVQATTVTSNLSTAAPTHAMNNGMQIPIAPLATVNSQHQLPQYGTNLNGTVVPIGMSPTGWIVLSDGRMIMSTSPTGVWCSNHLVCRVLVHPRLSWLSVATCCRQRRTFYQ